MTIKITKKTQNNDLTKQMDLKLQDNTVSIFSFIKSKKISSCEINKAYTLCQSLYIFTLETFCKTCISKIFDFENDYLYCSDLNVEKK